MGSEDTLMDYDIRDINFFSSYCGPKYSIMFFHLTYNRVFSIFFNVVTIGTMVKILFMDKE